MEILRIITQHNSPGQLKVKVQKINSWQQLKKENELKLEGEELYLKVLADKSTLTEWFHTVDQEKIDHPSTSNFRTFKLKFLVLQN